MRNLILLFAAFTLVSCSTIEEMYTDVPKSVAVAQATLITAEHAAADYAKLDVCGKTKAHICRNPVVTAQIGALDATAYTAVDTAYKMETQDALNAALTALGALTSVTDNLPSIGVK